jgi:aminomuconate-semialdehyde/2-hydroxymuconate-6-semialdehyde dehydrogenase
MHASDTNHTVTHFIDGERAPSHAGEWFADISPVTREVWADVALGTSDDIAAAVQAAQRSFDDGQWSRAPVAERRATLERFADLLEAHRDELARLDVRDVGKPLARTAGRDVTLAANALRHAGGYAAFASDEAFHAIPGHHIYTRHQPVGVVGAIAPWNYPLMLGTNKIAPALAYGNSVVLKPAEQSPASATRVAELGAEAGLPPGVLNVVHGFGPGGAGEALVRHPLVRVLTFTGESGTGKAIMEAGASTLTRVSFELGGKGANLVFDDADLDESVRWSVEAAFGNTGQACLAGSRVLVQAGVYDRWLDQFVAAVGDLAIGDPFDPDTQIGPLSSEEHYQKVAGHLERALADGAQALTKGDTPEGWYVYPTVLADVGTDMAVYREEVFGPLVTVSRFDTEAEAVALANDSDYGLSAVLFTENVRRAHRVADQIAAGMVWVNTFRVRDPRGPFGGWKDSGLGREGGHFSRDLYTEQKAITVAM